MRRRLQLHDAVIELTFGGQQKRYVSSGIAEMATKGLAQLGLLTIIVMSIGVSYFTATALNDARKTAAFNSAAIAFGISGVVFELMRALLCSLVHGARINAVVARRELEITQKAIFAKKQLLTRSPATQIVVKSRGQH